MASLALIAGLIFLLLIFVGPFSYIICLFSWIPNLIKYLLGIICIGIGLWAIFIPVPIFQMLGLVNLAIGLKILLRGTKKELKLDKVE
jgi:hypothetical protein